MKEIDRIGAAHRQRARAELNIPPPVEIADGIRKAIEIQCDQKVGSIANQDRSVVENLVVVAIPHRAFCYGKPPTGSRTVGFSKLKQIDLGDEPASKSIACGSSEPEGARPHGIDYSRASDRARNRQNAIAIRVKGATVLINIDWARPGISEIRIKTAAKLKTQRLSANVDILQEQPSSTDNGTFIGGSQRMGIRCISNPIIDVKGAAERITEVEPQISAARQSDAGGHATITNGIIDVQNVMHRKLA